MNRLVSSYYPPRARWYSPAFHLRDALRRRLCLDRIHLPAGISARGFIGGLLLPGVAFYARGERLIGRVVLFGCAALAVSFFVWLGYPVANLAFGLLLSAHVSSILFLFSPWLSGTRFRFQFMFGLALLAVVGGCIYAPVRNQIQENYLMPLRVRGRVVVVQTFSSANSVKKGDWIAYTLSGTGVPGVRVQEGLGLGPVLAVAGEHIRFAPRTFEVNGVSRSSLPHMPTTGELVVPKNNWFLWPELAINNRGNAVEAGISTTMFQLAIVSEDQFVGRPFKRWFWRKQLIP